MGSILLHLRESPTFVALLGNLVYWKVASLAIATALGIIALFGDFREKDGSLTRWGKLSLAGLLLSGLVGVGAEIVDSQQKFREANETNAKLQTLIAENQKLIQGNQQLTVKNQSVLENTEAALHQEADIYEASKATIRGVERTLSQLGDEGSVPIPVEK
jgi:hypothetical protein